MSKNEGCSHDSQELPITPNNMEERFYRQLFLKRYALLLEKAERIYNIPKDTMDHLKREILSLDWVDPAIKTIHKKTGSTLSK